MRNQDVELNPVAPGVIQTEHNGKLNRGFDCPAVRLRCPYQRKISLHRAPRELLRAGKTRSWARSCFALAMQHRSRV